MVSVGTIFSLATIGAIIIGGYTVYRNADKISGALTRGVTQSISNPFGNFIDSLWSGTKNISNNNNTNSQQTTSPQQQSGVDYKSWLKGEDNRTPQQVDTWYSDNKITNPRSTTPSTYTPTPYKQPTPKNHKAGYYYFNVKGKKYDTQQHLTSSQAKNLFTLNPKKVFSEGGLQNIAFIGTRKLQQSGFNLFGKSKGFQ